MLTGWICQRLTHPSTSLHLVLLSSGKIIWGLPSLDLSNHECPVSGILPQTHCWPGRLSPDCGCLPGGNWSRHTSHQLGRDLGRYSGTPPGKDGSMQTGRELGTIGTTRKEPTSSLFCLEPTCQREAVWVTNCLPKASSPWGPSMIQRSVTPASEDIGHP